MTLTISESDIIIQQAQISEHDILVEIAIALFDKKIWHFYMPGCLVKEKIVVL